MHQHHTTTTTTTTITTITITIVYDGGTHVVRVDVGMYGVAFWPCGHTAFRTAAHHTIITMAAFFVYIT